MFFYHSRVSGWVGKEGETYPDGDRMGGGSQNHSPHYHSPHYAETDPLMDHTHRGGIRSGANEGQVRREGGLAGSTQEHSTQKHTQNSGAKTVSLAVS